MTAPVTPFDLGELGRAIDTLFAEHPELAEDETLRADMLEGSTNLHDILSRLLERRQDVNSMARGIRGRIQALRARQARYEALEMLLDELALRILNMAKVRKVVLPEATLAITAGRKSVDLAPDAEVPDEYCRIKKEPNKTLIREALETGTSLNWATLSEREPSLLVRVR